MFKIQEIRELIRLIDQSSINEFKYENDDTKITLKKNNGAISSNSIQQTAVEQPTQESSAPVVVQSIPNHSKTEETKTERTEEIKEEADSNLLKIESPMVGTFYAAPSPEEPPYVQVGDKVKEDSIVCIVEAMKLFNEIEAEVKGEIVEVLVENGQLVEYGQPLFLVKPE